MAPTDMEFALKGSVYSIPLTQEQLYNSGIAYIKIAELGFFQLAFSGGSNVIQLKKADRHPERGFIEASYVKHAAPPRQNNMDSYDSFYTAEEISYDVFYGIEGAYDEWFHLATIEKDHAAEHNTSHEVFLESHDTEHIDTDHHDADYDYSSFDYGFE